jgi:hypothetical protein
MTTTNIIDDTVQTFLDDRCDTMKIDLRLQIQTYQTRVELIRVVTSMDGLTSRGRRVPPTYSLRVVI